MYNLHIVGQDPLGTDVQVAMQGPCMADPRFLNLLFNVF